MFEFSVKFSSLIDAARFKFPPSTPAFVKHLKEQQQEQHNTQAIVRTKVQRNCE